MALRRVIREVVLATLARPARLDDEWHVAVDVAALRLDVDRHAHELRTERQLKQLLLDGRCAAQRNAQIVDDAFAQA